MRPLSWDGLMAGLPGNGPVIQLEESHTYGQHEFESRRVRCTGRLVALPGAISLSVLYNGTQIL